MSVPAGRLVYAVGKAPCSGVGVVWSQPELDAAMAEEVPTALFDSSGGSEALALLTAVAESEFGEESLRELLDQRDRIEDWRVGEAIGEVYLSNHRRCFFPWPAGRDSRTRHASLPGADLVGFTEDADGACFAFAEVKTSAEKRYPPSVMHGSKGLSAQIESLRDSQARRDDLVTYICYRAKNAPWFHRFKRAFLRYLQDKSDVRLYGFLVRDVEPCSEDLRGAVTGFGYSSVSSTVVEFVALYLPSDSIRGIGTAALKQRGFR